MFVVDPSWILKAMIDLEPGASYRDTYERTATSIARAASRSPIAGQGEERTAAIIVAVMWYESRFQPDARGDCAKSTEHGTCAPGSTPRSFCAMQVHETNFRGYRTTQAEMLSDIDKCVGVGLQILAESFRVCARAPFEERLRHYAGGGPVCTPGKGPTEKSKHRMNLAVRVYSKRTPAQERVSASAAP